METSSAWRLYLSVYGAFFNLTINFAGAKAAYSLENMFEPSTLFAQLSVFGKGAVGIINILVRISTSSSPLYLWHIAGDVSPVDNSCIA